MGFMWFWLFLFAVASGGMAAGIAQHREGCNRLLWFLLGALFPLVAHITLAAMPRSPGGADEA